MRSRGPTRRRHSGCGARFRVAALDPGQQAPLPEVGEQAGEPRRARGAEARLRLGDQVAQVARAVEELEQLGVVVRQAQEVVALEVAQHPPAPALVGLEPLERVAGADPRAQPELGRAGLGRGAEGGHDERRARPHDDRPPGLGLAAPALHDQLLVAELDAHAVVQCRRAREPAAVEVGAVAGAGVLDPGRRAVAGRDARVPARDARVGELERAARRAPDQDVPDQRHAVAAGEHELERRLGPGQRLPAAVADGRPARQAAAAAPAQHPVAYPVMGWKVGLSPPSFSDRWSRGESAGSRTSSPVLRAEAVVGLHDHELLPVGPPDHLAGLHARPLGVRQLEVVGLGEEEL